MFGSGGVFATAVCGTFALLLWRRLRRQSGAYSSSTCAQTIVQDYLSIHHGTLVGKVFIVTGANEGLGFETARVLALGGAEVVLACRSEDRANEAISRIHNDAPNKELKLRFLPLDLCSLASVHAFSQLFEASRLPLHGLVNNAGIYHLPNFTLSPDGFELTWAVNYLGPWFLTSLLAKQLKLQPGARVVNVSSKMHEVARYYTWWYHGSARPWNMCSSPPNPGEYGPTWAYARTKASNIMHAFELSRQLGVEGFSVEPGLVRTKMTRHQSAWSRELTYLFMSPIVKSPGQGAATTLYCLLHPGLAPGYYADCKVSAPLAGCFDEVNSKALWQLSDDCVKRAGF